MSPKETATVLAALRSWQDELEDMGGAALARGCRPEHFADVEPLTHDEIDTLCEELNFESSPTKPDEVSQPKPEQLAQLFHETYEDEAPRHSYTTREASAKPWSEVPENNRNLMIETCRRILKKMFEEGWPDNG